MANPAVKNGYIAIANELAEQLALNNIPGEEMRIIWVLWRKTWGFKDGERRKDWDWISITQFEKMTGMKRGNVCSAINSLVAKRILLKKEGLYKFNQDYSEWVVSKRIPSSQKDTRGSSQKDNKGSSQKTTHKRKKENNTKEMKNKKYFVNQYRERAGKKPMETKMTESQLDFFERCKLIPIFQESVNAAHSKSYFTNPHDIEDLKKENSKINGAIKVFWIRCDKDLKKATEIIKWYGGKYGEWKQWSPMYCFRKDTVLDFENNGTKKVIW